VPPALTISVPPLEMTVGSANPPDETSRIPPLDTVVPIAVPPARIRSPPLTTVTFDTVCPEVTV
jgi:hypothetical protein